MNLPNRFNTSPSELRGIILVILGIAALVFYYSWWFKEGRLASPLLLFSFLIAIIYTGIQLVGNWLLYLATHHRPSILTSDKPADLSVDVFVTACGEDPALVEKALDAAYRIRGNHKTWLLDDMSNPELESIAQRLGAGYLTRDGSKDAKAGNINAALKRTNGDIVVIFDIDHIPKSNFLEQTLRYFADPEMGFVQVMLTFENNEDGWVARAAAETSLDFYNPTLIGADGLRGATLIGSNALIRRTALNSINGYKPGLAEDLATSIALHAAGWKSVYVNEPLAPGMAPPDLPAWFTQQLKWARGVFELLLTDYPRCFPRLKLGQKISYGVRMTYYWVGPIIFLHLLVTLLALFSGDPATTAAFDDYLFHLFPLMGISILIRQLALRRWRHESIEARLQWKPMALVYATWPIYTLAWVMAVLRLPLGFRPTPKYKDKGINPIWLSPQLLFLLSLGLGTIYSLFNTEFLDAYLLLGFVAVQGFPQIGILARLLLPFSITQELRAIGYASLLKHML